MDSSKIEDFLECSVCLEQLDERSRVLPCQHTFCLNCLAIVFESKGHLQCPECRTDFPQLTVNDLPRNVLLIRILEGLKVSQVAASSTSPSSNGNNQAERTKPKDTTKRLSAKVKYEALCSQPCCRGLYNFVSSEAGDLPFSKGDVITLLHEIDDNWLEGLLKGKRGSIPKNFVETLVPLPKINDDTVKKPFAKALFSYENKDESELISFKEGDIIGIIKKVDRNWFEGILGGQYGIFPVNFVRLNKAGHAVMGVDSSSGSGSSSDEDTDRKKKRRAKRNTCKSRCKNKKQTTSTIDQLERSESSLHQPQADNQSKRHTIHIENPNEQRRDSRRALNLSDDQDQLSRPRTQSQGRRSSESSIQDTTRSLASTILLNRALRNSSDGLTCNATTSVPVLLPQPGSVMMTSITNRPELTLSFSTSTNTTSTPSPLGLGEIYIALFTYSPSQDDELALIQGDQYYVVEKHLDGWYKGYHLRSNQTGVFPGNYVKPSNQITPQMMRNVNSNPAMNAIGYGSNPSSPSTAANGTNVFNFPSQCTSRNDGTEFSAAAVSPNGENSSPSRSSGMVGLFKLLKINKSSKRQQTQSPTTTSPVTQQPTNIASSAQPSSSQSVLQAPPSYYHSSMPAPAHHRLSRPSPMLPVEPPPPYTPTATTYSTTPTTQSLPIITNSSQQPLGEKFRATETYPGCHENELSFRIHDIIYVTKKHTDGWYKGRLLRTGASGIFPSTFVEACL